MTSDAARQPSFSACSQLLPARHREQEARRKKVAGAGRIDHLLDGIGRNADHFAVGNDHRALGAHGDRRELGVLGDGLHRIVEVGL